MLKMIKTMDNIFECPICDHEFKEQDADILIRNMDFNSNDVAIQATSLIYCPECGNVVLAVFDSLQTE